MKIDDNPQLSQDEIILSKQAVQTYLANNPDKPEKSFLQKLTRILMSAL